MRPGGRLMLSADETEGKITGKCMGPNVISEAELTGFGNWVMGEEKESQVRYYWFLS